MRRTWVLLAILLAGCGREASSPPPAVTIVRINGAQEAAFLSIVDGFNADPASAGLHVVAPRAFLEAPEQIDQQLQVFASRFSGVDLLLVKPHGVVFYDDAEWIQPIGEAAEGFTQPILPGELLGIDPPTLTAYQTRKGEEAELPGLPLYRSATFLAYWRNWRGRPEWSDDGVKAASSLEGLRKLLEASKADAAGPPLVLDGRDFHADFLSLVLSNGGDLVTDSEEERTRGAEVYSWLQGLVAAGLSTPIGVQDRTFASERQRRLTRFRAREAPILLGSGASLGVLRTLPGKDMGELRVLALPHAASVPKARSIRQDEVLVINRYSTHKNEAARFLRYAARADVLGQGGENNLLLPARATPDFSLSARGNFLDRIALVFDEMQLEIAPFPPGLALLVEDRLHLALGERPVPGDPRTREAYDTMELRLRFEMSQWMKR